MDVHEVVEQVEEFFADPTNRGVGDVQEIVDLTSLPASRVRSFCRREGLRRVGTTYCLDEDDVHELLIDSGMLDDDEPEGDDDIDDGANDPDDDVDDDDDDDDDDE